MAPEREGPARGAEEIIERSRRIAAEKGPATVAVAVAQNAEVLEAVRDAHRAGFARAILFGDRDQILSLCQAHQVDPAPHEIVDERDPALACRLAVAAAAEGRADVIMKGIVPTAVLMRNVLDKAFGLRQGRVMSHVAVLDIPTYHKLLAITDGGMVISSTLQQRIEIVENVIVLMHSLGVHQPKVALLAADDYVNLAMPVTGECAIIAKMAERGQIRGAIVDGPLTLDMAVYSGALERQPFPNPVAGDADILVTDSIDGGNALIKSMAYFAHAHFAGVIVGARVPLSLVSRSDTAFNKTLSLALAAVYSRYVKEHRPHD